MGRVQTSKQLQKSDIWNIASADKIGQSVRPRKI